MLRWFTADLHVHTCLSPCGDVTMSPRRIIREALRRELDMLAVTDHNSAENTGAVIRAAEGSTIRVIPGLEVCSMEEVHILALFETVPPALRLQQEVYDGIPSMNNPEVFGMQVIANEFDEVEGFQERLLIGATEMSVDEVVRRIHELDGVAIASHVDRQSYGILGQLGFIPDTVRFDALEVSASASEGEVHRLLRQYDGYAFVRNSDAHALDQVGAQTTSVFLEQPTVRELARAFRRENGRKVAAPAGREGGS